MKKLKKSTIFMLAIMILGITYSCLPEEIAPSNNNAYIETSPNGVMVLGEKLDNPYSLANMQQAAENLGKTNGREDGEIEIAPTHLYVKFKPKSYEELELLHTSDTTLILFSYPLDYKIKENGSYYHDPEVPKDKPTYQYTSVPIDYDFPAAVDYKILEEVYIPTMDENNNGRTEEEAMALEAEAFRITGNLPESANGSSKANNGRTEGWLTWRPSGRLRVWDDIIGSYTTSTQVFSHWEYYDCGDIGIDPFQTQQKGISSDLPSEQLLIEPIEECRRAIYTTVYQTRSGSYIPLEGITVRAHTFVKISTGKTNVDGNFSCNFTFAKGAPVQYSLVWETLKYRIFHGSSIYNDYNMGYPALHNGPLQDYRWQWDIGSGNQLGFATLHRAAHRYYEKDIDGLNTPPTAFGRMAISYKDADDTGLNLGHYYQQLSQGLPLANIYVWSIENGVRKLTNKVFATTIHELGHSSHIDLMQNLIDFWQVDKIIRESWAEAVEWHITRIEYESLGVANYDDTNEFVAGSTTISNDWFRINGTDYHLREHKQWWTRSGSHEYTPVFIDMVDMYNQRAIRFSGPEDPIIGYNMEQIENDILPHSYTLGSLRSQLQSNRPNGVTWNQVNTYMNYYNW